MADHHPTGTVTFFFTDVEDSTGLASRFRSDFADLMGTHTMLIREAVAEFDGVEVKTTGDGVFAAFASAGSAVAAAIGAQQSLASHSWPAGGEVKVRIGLHTGEATFAEGDYSGLEVHRAARVMSAAHGGQVVLTEATRILAGNAFEFRDLGRHLLRGLEDEESIYQVMVPGLPEEFPPLRTASAVPNNLPTRLSRVIGREDDLSAICDLVTENRFVTVLGPGGVGKTSVSLEAASRLIDSFKGGVSFVDLSTITQPDLVAATIAADLGAEPRTLEGIADHIGTSRCLLVLDNFEQVSEAATDVEYLLENTAESHIMITSQVPLRLSGETRYILDPFDPDSSESIDLFLEYARSANPSFEGDDGVIRELVDALGGLPLAMELVASRSNVLDAEEMLERLRGERLRVETRSARVERHRSLDDALRWSYELLDPSTQTVFRRLGVFAGSFSIDALERVAGDHSSDVLDELAELVDRSLVRRVVSTRGRFSLLEGIRRFANRLLGESEEADATAAKFVEFYLDLCRHAFQGLQSDRGEWWRAQLAEEIENLRLVLSMLLELGRKDDGLGLLGDTWRFYQSRGMMMELDSWLERFFDIESGEPSGAGTVKGLMARAAFEYWRENPDEAIVGYEEAVRLARALDEPLVLAEALYGLATSLIVGRRTGEAYEMLDESRSVFEDLGDERGLADVVAAEAFADLNEKGFSETREKFRVAGELYDKVGRKTQATQSLFAQAGAAFVEGQLEDAEELALEGIRRGLEMSDVFLQVWGLEYISLIACEAGEEELGGLLAGATREARRRIGGGWSPSTIGIEDTVTVLERRRGPAGAEDLMRPGRELSITEAIAIARERSITGRSSDALRST